MDKVTVSDKGVQLALQQPGTTERDGPVTRAFLRTPAAAEEGDQP